MAGEILTFKDPSITSFGRELSEEEKINVLAQGLSAVINYPKERRGRQRNFHPFLFLTSPFDPKGVSVMVGDLEGEWDEAGKEFNLKSIDLIRVESSLGEMVKTIEIIQHFNPGVPKIASDSFRELMHQRKLKMEEDLKRITVGGAQESALF